jgi:hypothetical protein
MKRVHAVYVNVNYGLGDRGIPEGTAERAAIWRSARTMEGLAVKAGMGEETKYPVSLGR